MQAAGGRGCLIAMDGCKRPPIDWAALMPKVARRLFDGPRMKDGGDIWRYGSDESLDLHVGGPRHGTWYDHKSGNGGDTLDLVKHVLRRDEANAIRWLKDQGLIGRPQHDQEDCVTSSPRSVAVTALLPLARQSSTRPVARRAAG